MKKLKGENVNIDIKKLYGKWEGYYRLRKGKIRVILRIDVDEKIVFIERLDFRGEVYK